VLLSACGDKFAGTWKPKDDPRNPRLLKITKVSGNTYTIYYGTGVGMAFGGRGTRQGDTIHMPVNGPRLPGYPTETTLTLVSGGLEMKSGGETTMFARQ
jgi:hypothetical protein